MKKDARYRATEEALLQSMIELMKEKPLHMISIKELTGRAGIDNATFYRHYTDIREWRETFEKGYVHAIEEKFHNSEQKDWKSLLRILLIHLSENKETSQMLMGENFRSFVLMDISRCLLDEVDNEFFPHQAYRIIGKAGWPYQATSAAINALIIMWINSGMHEEIEELISYIENDIFSLIGYPKCEE